MSQATSKLLGKRKCKSCGWWGYRPSDYDDSFEDRGNFKRCGNPNFVYGYWIENNVIPEAGALIENDEGWGMFVGPDFGCVHWKRR